MLSPERNNESATPPAKEGARGGTMGSPASKGPSDPVANVCL
jgi:hypothetical protein